MYPYGMLPQHPQPACPRGSQPSHPRGYQPAHSREHQPAHSKGDQAAYPRGYQPTYSKDALRYHSRIPPTILTPSNNGARVVQHERSFAYHTANESNKISRAQLCPPVQTLSRAYSTRQWRNWLYTTIDQAFYPYASQPLSPPNRSKSKRAWASSYGDRDAYLCSPGDQAPNARISHSPFSRVHLPKFEEALAEKEKGFGTEFPPPNGGRKAWMQVAGCFFLFFNSWGIVNGFGVFQTYYRDNPYWTASPSDISWIGSIQAFLLLLVGLIAGPLYDSGYCRQLILTGAILVPFGFMMTSLAKTYWQALLAQAVCIGVGCGCLFVPSVAILPQYFTTKKAMVNGFASSGSAVGGIIYPVAFRELEKHVGFGWATRVLGLIAVVTCGFCVPVVEPRMKPASKRKMVDLEALKDIPYNLFCLNLVFVFAGIMGPLFYIQAFGIDRQIVGEDFAFNLVPILNLASVVGRLIANFVADYTGPINVLIPCSLVCAVLAFAWSGVRDFAEIIIFSLSYGFVSGGCISVSFVAIVSLTPDLRKLGTRMGQALFFSGIGILCGAPILGVILTRSGTWLGPQLFSGSTMLLASCLVLAARVACKGWGWRVRA